jgi:hypothetical protein
MLKEYLSEAVSLITEVVLEKPIQAQAADCYYEEAVFPTDACTSCGAEKRHYAWFRRICCPTCGSWVKISNEWCDYC